MAVPTENFGILDVKAEASDASNSLRQLLTTHDPNPGNSDSLRDFADWIFVA